MSDSFKRQWHEQQARPDGKVHKFFVRIIGGAFVGAGVGLLAATVLGPMGVAVGALGWVAWWRYDANAEQRRIAKAQRKLAELDAEAGEG